MQIKFDGCRLPLLPTDQALLSVCITIYCIPQAMTRRLESILVVEGWKRRTSSPRTQAHAQEQLAREKRVLRLLALSPSVG